MEKGVVISLVAPVIRAGGNAPEARVFYSMFGNVKFQVLDWEVGLGEDVRYTVEGDKE